MHTICPGCKGKFILGGKGKKFPYHLTWRVVRAEVSFTPDNPGWGVDECSHSLKQASPAT